MENIFGWKSQVPTVVVVANKPPCTLLEPCYYVIRTRHQEKKKKKRKKGNLLLNLYLQCSARPAKTWAAPMSATPRWNDEQSTTTYSNTKMDIDRTRVYLCKIPSPLFFVSLVFVWLRMFFHSLLFRLRHTRTRIVGLLFPRRNNTTTTSGGGWWWLRRRWRQPWKALWFVTVLFFFIEV